MALESATYLNGLVSSNPTAGDPVTQADDHLRLIKAVLLATFPNLNAPVTASPAQINTAMPTGCILMWSGASTAIPTGWGLCDGSTYAKLDGSGNIVSPDLRDRFVLGAGPVHAVDATGGASAYTPTIAVANHALTLAELPAAAITITDPGHGHTLTDPGHTHTNSGVVGSASAGFAGGAASAPYTAENAPATGSSTTGVTLANATTGITAHLDGSGTAHGHIATSDSVPTVPPYHTLAYILKL